MLYDSFRRILQALNPDITFEWNNQNLYGTVGVYVRHKDRDFEKRGIDRPVFLMGIPRDYLPDYDEIDSRTGSIVRRGWRNALMILWSLGQVKDKQLYRELTRGWRTHAA